jgi:hypothetical protein
MAFPRSYAAQKEHELGSNRRNRVRFLDSTRSSADMLRWDWHDAFVPIMFRISTCL